MLDDLMLNAKDNSFKIIASDFNVCALDWGSRVMKIRSQNLLETSTDLGVVLVNVGYVHFSREG